jgi:N-acetylmuramoyl-L-alanine amidase
MAGQSSSQPETAWNGGPVGAGEHVVRDGECLSSIAKRTGHFWETLWNDPGNAELKAARKDPNLLLPGDRLVVPPPRPKEESGQAEQRHRFRRKGEPAKLRFRFVKEPDLPPAEQPDIVVVQSGKDSITEDPDPRSQAHADEPRANAPYILDIDGELQEGTTDADGILEVPVSGNAREARVIFDSGTDHEQEYHFTLGHLNPISEVVGVKQRLANLTFECGDRSNELTDGLRWAIEAFQFKHGLEQRGELTDDLRRLIQDLHGS